jgi:hypothetical protein
MARYGVVVFSIVMMAATVVLAGDTNLSVAVKGV